MTRPSRDDAPSRVTPDTDTETLRRAVALVRAWRDPAMPGLVFLIAVAVAGAAALVFTVFQVASLPYVALQLPFVVSGAFGGAALITMGAMLAAVLAERRDRVVAREEMRELVDELCAVIHLAVQRRR